MEQTSTATPIALGNAGVLAPGRWRWARALGWMLALFVGAGVLIALVQLGWSALIGKSLLSAHIATILGLSLAYAGYSLAVRYGERRPVDELALRALPRDLIVGVLVGAGMFTLVFASLRLGGWYTLSSPHPSDVANDFAGNLVTGLFEELLLRAIVFRLIWRAFGLTTAFVVSAALFGALHLANPNATWFAAVAIAIEAGLMLASFYALTGRLWMSIGVHAAWNFMQGPIFGARVSGNVEKGSVFQSAPVPGYADILTGGPFGPEASLPAIIVGSAVFAIVLIAIRRRTRVMVHSCADVSLPE